VQEIEHSRRISRRKFLIVSGSSFVVGGAAAVGGWKLFETLTKSSENQISARFGVLVPLNTDERFFIKEDTYPKLYDLSERNPADLTTDEANIIEESLSRIPYAGKLAPLLLPYRYKSESDDSGITGIYWGRRWSSSIKKFNSDHLDEDAATALFLPENFSPDREVEPSLVFTGIAGDRGRSTAFDEIPLGTYRDAFNRTVLHEYGHALADAVFYLARPLEAYKNESSNSMYVPYFNVLANHPIYQSFAKVNGWKLIPIDETGLGPDSDDYKQAIEKGGEYPWGSPGAWIRDTEVWGEGPYEQIPWLATKKIRLTQYASVAMIHETFAEFYMASVLYPEYLTKEEGAYFGRLHEGLKKDAKAFLKQIAKNPDILRIS